MTPAPYVNPRVSPDGASVVVQSNEDDGSVIWVYDLSGDTTIRQLTFEGNNNNPVWTPDGEWVTFSSDREGPRSIYQKRADGSGLAQRLTTAEEGTSHVPESWSPDGRLSFRVNTGGQNSVWTLSGESGATSEVFVDLPESNQRGSVFSPDGKWIAYDSDESGRIQIYLQPFPPTGSKQQITQGRGLWPLWSPDGSQLFFRSTGQQLMAVDIETTPAVTFGSPKPIPIRGPGDSRNFDVMPDGERFIAVVPVTVEETEDEEAPAGQINIVLNWFEELKERVPVP